MSRPAPVFLVPLLLVVLGCGQEDEAKQQAIRESSDESFSQFASVLYERLEDEPLDLFQVDVGLFGDLSVTSGESIIMGRYRYLTDTVGPEPQARMAFLIRDEGTRNDPIPVILRFVARDGRWLLEEASYDADETPSTPFEAALHTHFNDWISTAVEGAQETWVSE